MNQLYLVSNPLAEYFQLPPKLYRSVNLLLDQEDSTILGTYIPTLKSTTILDLLLHSLTDKRQEKANVIIAPYGSGKSTLLLLWSSLLERSSSWKRNEAVILRSIDEISKDLVQSIKEFRKRTKPYLVVRFSGDCLNLQESYVDQLRLSLKKFDPSLRRLATKLRDPHLKHDSNKAIQLFLEIAGQLSNHGYQGIYFIHDEFGKVLEHFGNQSNQADLFFTQALAEACNRTKSAELNLLISLHQGFSQYANKLPSHIRSEWTKVEGRFRQTAFIEDSDQVYDLIGNAVRSIRTDRFNKIANSVRNSSAEYAQQAACNPLFEKYSNPTNLNEVFASCFPLDPGAIFLLPRLSARLAQNERTLFHYLLSLEAGCLLSEIQSATNTPGSPQYVRIHHLFNYFSDLIRSDTGTGGTYKRWIEITAALQRIQNNSGLEGELIKTIGLLSLISVESGIPVNESVIALCIGAFSQDRKEQLRKALNSLVSSKTLLFRKHKGEYSIWEGSDVDLHSIVRQRAAEKASTFQLSHFLRQEFFSLSIPASRHNDERWINRFFQGRFISVEELEKLDPLIELSDPSGVDGYVFYVLAENRDDIARATKRVIDINAPRMIFSVPNKSMRLRQSILEFAVLKDLLSDSEFLSQDPLIRRELAQLADDTKAYAEQQLLWLSDPSTFGASWYCGGKKLDEITSRKDLMTAISNVCNSVYELTPIIKNELINRKQPSAVIVNSRRKVMRHLLENLGKEDIGLVGHGPDVFIFRSSLLNTGLYQKPDRNRPWQIVDAESVSELHLGAVMQLIKSYFDSSKAEPKSLDPLIQQMISPPYGVRRGIIPLLLCAATIAYSSGLNIIEEGIFVKEIKPELFDKIVEYPEKILIQSCALSTEVLSYVHDVQSVFRNLTGDSATIQQKDPIRGAVEAMYAWLHQIPSCAMNTKELSQPAIMFRTTLIQAKDPVALLVKDIPRIFTSSEALLENTEVEEHRYGQVSEQIERCVYEISSHKDRICHKAEDILKGVFLTNSGSLDLRSSFLKWRQMLSPDIHEYLTDSTASGFLSRIATQYSSDVQLVESLAALIVGRSISFWDDSSVKQFELGLIRIHDLLIKTSQLLSSRSQDKTDDVIYLEIQKNGVEWLRSVIEDTPLSSEGSKLEQFIETTLKSKFNALSKDELQRVLVKMLERRFK